MFASSVSLTRASPRASAPVVKKKPSIASMNNNVFQLIFAFLSKKEIAYFHYTNKSFAAYVDRIWHITAIKHNIPLVEMAPGRLILPAKEQILQHIDKVNRVILVFLFGGIPWPVLNELNSERKNPLATIAKITKWFFVNTQTNIWNNVSVAHMVCSLAEEYLLDPLEADATCDALKIVFKTVKEWQDFSPSHERHFKELDCCDPLGFQLPIKGCCELQQMVVHNQLANQKILERDTYFTMMLSSLLANPIPSEERCKLIAALLESNKYSRHFKRLESPCYEIHGQVVTRYAKYYRFCLVSFIEGYTFPEKQPFSNLKLLLHYCPNPIIYGEACETLDKILQKHPDYTNWLKSKAHFRRGYEMIEIITDVLNIKTASEYHKMSHISKKLSRPYYLPCQNSYNHYQKDYIFALKLAQSSSENIVRLLASSRHIKVSQSQLKEIKQRLDAVPNVDVQEKQLEEIHKIARQLIQDKIDEIDAVPKKMKSDSSCVVM